MNRKQIITAFVVLLAGGALYLLLKFIHRPAPAEGDEEAPTLVSVQVGHLRRATLHGYVDGYGSVLPAPAEADQPAATANVAPSVAGVVTQVLASEGAYVNKGAELFALDSRAARVTLKSAEQTAERQKKLYAEGNTSLHSLQDAEAQLATAQTQLALLQVTAPLSGTVTRVNVRPGEAVDLTTTLGEITDLDRLVVAAQIPASEARALHPGQKVQILSDPPVAASLNYVSSTVDPANGTILVRGALPPGSALRPGEWVHLRIVTATHVQCLVAPAESVVTNPQGRPVIAIVNNGEATQIPIETGLRDNHLVEIQGAKLKAGDAVVTIGAYGLPKKTRIQVVKP